MPHRFYMADLQDAGTVTLEGLEAHHLMHVLRASPGDIVEIFNGAGLVASAQIEAIRKRDAQLRVLGAHREGQPTRQIVLATAVPKGDRFDWLIEKSTELGVTRIIPLVTARSVVDPRDSKLDKLRQTVIAACKQCGRNSLLELSPVTSWSDFVRDELAIHGGYIAHPGSGAVPIAASLLSGIATVVLAVGPEGGFKDEEVAAAIECGARPISLGPLILRIETAGIALAALATAN